ncbi:MAG: glycosyltransferase family 1 protein [Phycisphaeraceae bacterium]|nr:MAG: glycosyltransferase family 1 protein [Phycisphaeraceae bacterium]
MNRLCRGIQVAYMAPGWPPDKQPSGINTHILQMHPALMELGANVHILAQRTEESAVAYNVTRISDYRRKHGIFDAARTRVTGQVTRVRDEAIAMSEAARHVQELYGLDVIEMEESFGWAGQLKHRLEAPVVVRLHGPWFLSGEALGVRKNKTWRKRVWMEGVGIRLADGITAPSADVLERTRRYYGIALENAVVIPDPAPLHSYKSRWSDVLCNHNELLFIGRFDRLKGGDVIIDAFAQLAANHKSLRLRFVGPDRGILGDNGMRWSIDEYVRQRIPDLQARRRVEIVGTTPYAALDEMRRRAYLTVVCSRYETFGNTAVEAMALGCPLIASRVGGLAEIVEDERSGLLVEPGNSRSLATAIEALLADPARASALGKAAALRCETAFSPDKIARRTLKYYTQIISQWTRRQATV